MLKPILLRLHRWITLVFALPLLAIIFTGLILSFQPIVQTVSIKPNSLTLAKFDAIMAKYDKEGKTRSIFVDPYENSISLVGVGPDGSTDVDLTTLEEVEDDNLLSEWFSSSRRLHERLIYSMGWLVEASTFAMLALVALGIAMGWPRIRNNVSGWHKATAWFLLPLVIISPLTGLFLAYNVTFAPAPAGGRTAAPPAAQRVQVRDAIAMIADKHDLSNLSSLGNRGGRFLARVNDGGKLRAYAVTPQGLTEANNNWPRLIHEGNWAGVWSGLINVITSIALLLLLFTGLFIWAKRTFRRKPSANRARRNQPATAPTEAAA